jgi:hypothetical protein
VLPDPEVMIDRRNQSGWLTESQVPQGNFEVITTGSAPFRGLVHLRHHRAELFPTPSLWNETERIRSSRFLGPIYGSASIVSGYGNLEVVVAYQDESLVHFWREGSFGWHGPNFLPGQAAGPPAFIQSRFGGVGNFEVIVPRPDGGLSHFWRDNDHDAAWHEAAQPNADLHWSGLGLLHSSDGVLEIIGIADGNLYYLFQQGPHLDWTEPTLIRGGCQGRPSLIQSAGFPNSRFLSIAPLAEGGLACLVRDQNTDFHWLDHIPFGEEHLQFDDVTMMQSSFGHTELMAREAAPEEGSRPILRLKHYRKSGWRWDGPNEVPSADSDA